MIVKQVNFFIKRDQQNSTNMARRRFIFKTRRRHKTLTTTNNQREIKQSNHPTHLQRINNERTPIARGHQMIHEEEQLTFLTTNTMNLSSNLKFIKILLLLCILKMISCDNNNQDNASRAGQSTRLFAAAIEGKLRQLHKYSHWSGRTNRPSTCFLINIHHCSSS